MQLTNKEKNLIFILIVVTLLVVSIRFIIMPSVEKNNSLKVELADAQQRQFEIQQLLSKGAHIDAEIDKMVESIAEVTPPFFNLVETEYMHRWVNSLANANNISIAQLTIGEANINAVTPYTKTQSSLSYPIATYYNNMVNSTIIDQAGVNNQTLAQSEGMDQVIHRDIDVKIKGTKNDIINFVNTISHLEKHAIVRNFTLAKYDVDEPKETTVNFTIYSIHKEDDGVFHYEF